MAAERRVGMSSGDGGQDPLALLLNYIEEAASGGSESFRQQQAERDKITEQTKLIQGDYSKAAAFQDAAMLIQQSLQKSMEANMPAISKAITGAGTSSSAMQGLLSQKLATDSAQAAGALGAQQAVSYGGISAQLASVLEGLSRVNMGNEDNLLRALQLGIGTGAGGGGGQGNKAITYNLTPGQIAGSSPGSLDNYGTVGQSSAPTLVSGDRSSNTSRYGAGGTQAATQGSGNSYMYQPYYNFQDPTAQDAFERYLWA